MRAILRNRYQIGTRGGVIELFRMQIVARGVFAVVTGLGNGMAHTEAYKKKHTHTRAPIPIYHRTRGQLLPVK